MVPISLIAPKSCHFMLGGLGHHLPTPPHKSSPSPPPPGHPIRKGQSGRSQRTHRKVVPPRIQA